MAQVTYHGEYPADADSITQYGYEFSGGKPASITDKAVLEKLSGNRFFNVSGTSDKEDVKEGQHEAEDAEAETLRAWLGERSVPVRANASLKALREARDDYEKRAEQAKEG